MINRMFDTDNQNKTEDPNVQDNGEMQPNVDSQQDSDSTRNSDAERNAGTARTDSDRPDAMRPGEDGIAYWKRISSESNGQTEEPKPERYWNSPNDFGFGRVKDPDYGPVPEEYSSNGMSRASMICGIISVVTMFFGGTFVFGILGILFALLSRKKKFSRQARFGLGLSAGTLAIFAVMMTMTVSMLVSNGSWKRIVRAAGQVDLSNAESVSAFEMLVYNELLRGYNRTESSPQETEEALNRTMDSLMKSLAGASSEAESAEETESEVQEDSGNNTESGADGNTGSGADSETRQDDGKKAEPETSGNNEDPDVNNNPEEETTDTEETLYQIAWREDASEYTTASALLTVSRSKVLYHA
ncbi:MAG: DUF4190 domain-containing protein [Lachnospiraceae bacterium]|nr:DUF4190 domain-containing protein [Lachnospiraceae bacterium]